MMLSIAREIFLQQRTGKKYCRQVKDHFGKLHVLVNNAGVAPKERKDILEATEESFDEVISTNLKRNLFSYTGCCQLDDRTKER